MKKKKKKKNLKRKLKERTPSSLSRSSSETSSSANIRSDKKSLFESTRNTIKSFSLYYSYWES